MDLATIGIIIGIIVGVIGAGAGIWGLILQRGSKRVFQNTKDYWEYREKLEIRHARCRVRKTKEEEEMARLEKEIERLDDWKDKPGRSAT